MWSQIYPNMIGLCVSFLMKGQQKIRVGDCNNPKIGSGFIKDGLDDQI